ncbi:MAG: hypothetical protein V2A69_15900 [Pseudomonadota bacterium]
MNWNTGTQKNTILLNDAGADQYDPILSGLPFTVSVRFNGAIQGLSGLVGSTPISFTVDPTDSLLYVHNAVAGVAPFTTGEKTVRITFTSTVTGKETVWEKTVYIAALPTDAIQVFDVLTQTWRSVNFGTTPGTIPRCGQMCPVRFFNSWYDEFRMTHFGGASLVSVYDYDTTEAETDEQYVRRDIEKDITRTSFIYLERHMAAVEETHDINVTFKTEVNSPGVTVRIKVTSLCCIGFEVKDPVIE